MLNTKNEIEKFIDERKDEALTRASKILEKETSMASFNGIIGSKNQIYELDPLLFDNATEYVQAWRNMHEKSYEEEKNFPHPKASHRVHKLLQDSLMEEFIENYLARTYYKKHK